MCTRCGYVMDAASEVGGSDAVPSEGDTSMCLNCICPYTRENGRWRLLSSEEVNALPSDVRVIIQRAQIVRAVAPFGDLSKRDRWA
jgi:hypothetical protein